MEQIERQIGEITSRPQKVEIKSCNFESSPIVSRSSSLVGSTDIDLCEVDLTDPLSIWRNDLLELAIKMQEQWREERIKWQQKVVPDGQDSTMHDEASTPIKRFDTDWEVKDTSSEKVQDVNLPTILTSSDSELDVDDEDENDDSKDVPKAFSQHLNHRLTIIDNVEVPLRNKKRTGTNSSTVSEELQRRISVIDGRRVLDITDNGPESIDIQTGLSPLHQNTSFPPMPNFPAPDLNIENSSPPRFPAPLLPPSPTVRRKSPTSDKKKINPTVVHL